MTNLIRWIAIGAVLFAPAAPLLAAPITWTVGPFNLTFYGGGDTLIDNYGDGNAGVQNWTQTEMQDVAAAVQAWVGSIDNPLPQRQINVDLMWTNQGGNQVNTWNVQTVNAALHTGYSVYSNAEYLWREGQSLSTVTTSADAYILLDAQSPFSPGSSDADQSSYDLRSTVAQQLGTVLGFDGTFNGTTWSSQGISAWDSLLRDAPSGGNKAQAGTTGTPHAFNATANPCYFVGPHALAVGGGTVAVYAPSPYDPNGSLYYLDSSAYPNDLMNPGGNTGPQPRSPSTLDLAILQDLGWVVTNTWTGGANLNWTNTGNWSLTSAPTDKTNAVQFTSAGLSSGTVSLGGNTTIQSLILAATTSFTLGGTGTLTLQSGNLTRLAASAGTQTIAIPLALGTSGTWNIGGSGALVVQGNVSGSGGLTILGNGLLDLAGSNGFTGPTTVSGGTLQLDYTSQNKSKLSGIVRPDAGGSGRVAPGQYLGTTAQTVSGLTVNAGDSTLWINANGGGGTTLTTGSISRNAGGTLNFAVLSGTLGLDGQFRRQQHRQQHLGRLGNRRQRLGNRVGRQDCGLLRLHHPDWHRQQLARLFSYRLAEPHCQRQFRQLEAGQQRVRPVLDPFREDAAHERWIALRRLQQLHDYRRELSCGGQRRGTDRPPSRLRHAHHRFADCRQFLGDGPDEIGQRHPRAHRQQYVYGADARERGHAGRDGHKSPRRHRRQLERHVQPDRQRDLRRRLERPGFTDHERFRHAGSGGIEHLYRRRGHYHGDAAGRFRRGLQQSRADPVSFTSSASGSLQLAGNNVTIGGLSTGTPTGAVTVFNGSSTPATLTVSAAANNTFAGVLQDGAGGEAWA